MSQWEDFAFEERIRQILQEVTYYREDHHMGRPFLTAYQIAIEYAHQYPTDYNQIGLPIGGSGIARPYLMPFKSRKMSLGH